MTIVPRLAMEAAVHTKWASVNFMPRRRVLAANERFRNLHRGRRCFILGSGKSILDQDLKLLRGDIVITQNNFHAHEDVGVFAPAYHCVVPMYQPPSYASDWVSWFRAMEARLPKTTQLFAGLTSRALLEQQRFFEGRRHYIRAALSSLYLRNAAYDLTRVVMEIGTALTMCLEVALFMGFSRICLLGFDLSQLCEGRDRDWGRFYGTSPVTRNDAERRFEDDYDWNGENYYQFWKMWRGFVLLRTAAEKRDIQIINATRGGLLNCFHRERYEDIVGTS